MSVDTFNDVLDTTMAKPNEEINVSFMNNAGITGQEIWTDPAMLEVFQFGYISNSPVLCYPNDIGNGAFSGEKSQGATSMDQNPFADGDQFLSSRSSDSTYSDQDALLFGGDETKDIGMAMENDSTYLSQADPNHFDHHTACRESTQSGSARAGWTYRQILEIVALPPPEGLHLWHDKVSQLAADLGMPSGATGKDIVNFVLRVASVKNELHTVTPLVKAIATAARVFEGRIVAPTTLLPVFLALYPSAGSLCGITAVGDESNAALERHHNGVDSSLVYQLIVDADASWIMSESVPDEEQNLKACQ